MWQDQHQPGTLARQEVGVPLEAEEAPEPHLGMLFLTRRCNLDCSYCHMTHTGMADTSKKTLQAGIDLLFESFDHLLLHFFGGEPLLRFDLIEWAHAYIEERWSHKPWPRRLVTTNGIMLQGRMLDWLVEREVELMLSVDGSFESQGEHRVAFGDNGKAYQQILDNIDHLNDRGIPYFVNSVVSPSNVDRMEDNLGHLVDMGATTIQFAYELGAMWSLEDQARYVRNLVRIKQRYHGLEGLTIQNRPEAEPVLGNPFFVVDVNGEMYQGCAIVLENSLPTFNDTAHMGHISSIPNLADRERSRIGQVSYFLRGTKRDMKDWVRLRSNMHLGYQVAHQLGKLDQDAPPPASWEEEAAKTLGRSEGLEKADRLKEVQLELSGERAGRTDPAGLDERQVAGVLQDLLAQQPELLHISVDSAEWLRRGQRMGQLARRLGYGRVQLSLTLEMRRSLSLRVADAADVVLLHGDLDGACLAELEKEGPGFVQSLRGLQEASPALEITLGIRLSSTEPGRAAAVVEGWLEAGLPPTRLRLLHPLGVNEDTATRHTEELERLSAKEGLAHTLPRAERLEDPEPVLQSLEGLLSRHPGLRLQPDLDPDEIWRWLRDPTYTPRRARGFCASPWQRLQIQVDGSITLCGGARLGRIDGVGAAELWRGDCADKVRRRLVENAGLSGCRGCGLRYRCGDRDEVVRP